MGRSVEQTGSQMCFWCPKTTAARRPTAVWRGFRPPTTTRRTAVHPRGCRLSNRRPNHSPTSGVWLDRVPPWTGQPAGLDAVTVSSVNQDQGRLRSPHGPHRPGLGEPSSSPPGPHPIDQPPVDWMGDKGSGPCKTAKDFHLGREGNRKEQRGTTEEKPQREA